MRYTRGRTFLLVLLLAILTLAAQGLGNHVARAQPAPPQPLDIVGHLGGAPRDVVIEGRYAYVATGYALDVWDIGDPAQPVRAGQLLRRGMFARGGGDYGMRLRVEGDHAFLADRGMVRIIDISDPTAPIEAGRFTLPATSFVDVVPNGAHLYLLGPRPQAGVVVVDISDVAAPVELMRTNDGTYGHLALAGHYLYAVGGISSGPPSQHGLRVYDVSTPGSPREVSSTPDVASIHYEMVVQGTHLYAATNSGLLIYDVADAAAVHKVALFATAYPVDDVYVADGRASITHGGILEVVDIADPSRPLSAGVHRVSSVPQYSAGDASLAAAGGIVLVTRITEGIIIVDASDVGRMRELTRVGTAASRGTEYGPARGVRLCGRQRRRPVHPVHGRRRPTDRRAANAYADHATDADAHANGAGDADANTDGGPDCNTEGDFQADASGLLRLPRPVPAGASGGDRRRGGQSGAVLRLADAAEPRQAGRPRQSAPH